MIKRWIIGRGLTTKVAFTFLTTMLALIVLMGGTLYAYFRVTTERSLVESLEAAMDSNANNVEELFTRIDWVSDVMSDYESPFAQNLLKPNSDLVVDAQRANDLQNLFKSYIGISIEPAVSWYSSFLFLDDVVDISVLFPQFSQSHWQYSAHTVQFFRSDKVENELWYQQAEALDGEQYWFKHPSSPNNLGFAQKLVHYQPNDNIVTKKNIGLLVIHFNVSWIQERIDTSQLTNGTFILLADMNNTIIYSDDPSLEGTALSSYFDEDTLRGSERQMIVADFRDANYFTRKKNLEGGMQFITLIPSADVEQISGGSLQIILVVMGISMVIGTLLILFFSHLVVKPIRRLSKYMEKNLSLAPIKYSGNQDDEVGVLYYRFNGLMRYVQSLIQDVFDSVQKQKEMNLRTLQAQINPHFVYNTLDSVCCVALMRGEEEMAEALSALAGFLRYNIKEPDKMVTILDEIAMIHNYMCTQRLQYRDALQFSDEVALEAQQCLIPKMIIQPLVENAVFHGMRSEGVKVRLVIWCEGDETIIAVHNDGEYTDGQINAINDRIRKAEDVTAATGGLGVRNVDQRVKLSFGGQYGLRFCKGKNNGIVARVNLPKNSRIIT